MNKSLLILLLALLSVPRVLLGQSDEDAEAKVSLFDIELIVFKNLQVPKGREFILPVSSPGKNEQIFELASSASVKAGREFQYELLAPDQFRLMETYSKLVASPRYEVLLHVAWRQPGVSLKQVIPVWIKGGRIFGEEFTSIDSQIEFFENSPGSSVIDDSSTQLLEFDDQNLEAMELKLQQQLKQEQQAAASHGGLYELEGKITIALSRYLHTYVDLVLRRPRLSIDPVFSNTVQEQYLAANAADTRILNNHQLKEHRRMRSKNLHYLDNPEFAMLILINHYKADDVEVDITELEALLPEVETQTVE
jgi:hypothetical protein